MPATELVVAGDWQIQLGREAELQPGRNLVPVEVVSGDRREGFSAMVILHHFGEVARARQDLSRDQPLDESLFAWQWQDLADIERGLAVGRSSVSGVSLTRNLSSGEILRQADLKETPIISAGDPVELQVRRGHVAVTVRAYARQNGCLGQTIPVRNELTGRLVHARVAGPGLVEWRK
jgi:flagella basal body P-ring formation protein FlgA